MKLLIVLGTSSSETVLPDMMRKLKLLGAPRTIVRFVFPTGYSFNTDGNNTHLTLCIVFLAQATNTHLAGRGFVSNGKANSVTIFDLKTLKTIAVVPVSGQNPDAIFYDAATKRVFTFNGKTKDATAINATDGRIIGTVALGGKPEFAAGAGDGIIFVNNEDTSQLMQFDARKLALIHNWPMGPCKSPSGLAMDTKNRRLFAVCDGGVMAILNADNGKVIATPKIGEEPDAAGFDPETGYAFSSNGGDGTLTVVHEDSPDKFTVVENVPTQKYARTMAIDFKTHNIFLPLAVFEGTTAAGERRPPMKKDSFAVLLVGK